MGSGSESYIDLRQKKILIVGDDYISQSISFKQLNIQYKPKTFNIISSEFAKLEDCIRLAQDYLKNSSDVDLMLLFPFLWDLSYMTPCTPVKVRRTLHLNTINLPSFNRFKDTVKFITEDWNSKYPNLIVYWCLPYTPDFTEYNSNSHDEVSVSKCRSMTVDFHRKVRELADCLRKIPDIHLLDLNDCYFLKEPALQHLFDNANNPDKLRHASFPPCTIDGLVPNIEFDTRFLRVFKRAIYPLLEPAKEANANQFEDNLRSFSNPERKNLNTFEEVSQSSFHGDEHKMFNTIEDNSSQSSFHHENNVTFEDRHSPLSFNPNASSVVSQAPSWYYHEQDPYKSNIVIDYQHSKVEPNMKPALPRYSSNMANNSYNSQHECRPNPNWQNSQQNNGQRNPLSVKEIWDLYDQQRDQALYSQTNSSNSYHPNRHMPDRGIPYYPNSNNNNNINYNSHTPNMPHRPMYDSSPQQNMSARLPSRGMGMSEFLRSDNAHGDNARPMHAEAQNPTQAMPSLPSEVMNSLQDALTFLSSKNQESKEEIIPSPYRKHLSWFFNPAHWTDLFLMGDSSVALDCLDQCVKALLSEVTPKKGLKIIMLTSSPAFIENVEKTLSPLVEKNVIGVNDNIPFGAPIVLVDLPSNLRLRLSQTKFESLSDLSAVLVFGDALLANKTPANVEVVYLIKYILSKTKQERLNKVVVSESGSTEAEIVAQNAFNTTFLVPKKDVKERTTQETTPENAQSSVGKPLSRYADPDSIFITKEHSDEIEVLPTNTKAANEDRSKKRSMEKEDRRRKRNTSKESEHTPVATPTGKVVSESPKPSKTTDSSPQDKGTQESKLEMVFKVARVPLSDEEKKVYEEHDKEFAVFLEVVGRTVENEYLKDGRTSLIEHDSNYKTYAEVPDLHPDYEEKFAIFVERFEHVYGKEYNPQHLQTTWKHFWDVMINSLKEKDWKESKKALQISFRKRYAKKHADILAEIEIKKAKKLARLKRNAEKEQKKKDETADIIIIEDVKSGMYAGNKRGKQEQSPDQSKRLKETKESSPKPVTGYEELKKLYIDTISKKSKPAVPLIKAIEPAGPPNLIDDLANSGERKVIKWPSKATDETKPKIIINLSKQKKKETVKYSLKETLYYLKVVSKSIGMMGPALESVIDKAKSFLPDKYKAYKVFDDSDSVLLVNIAINKMKNLATTCPSSDAETYRNAIFLAQKLLEEYKKALQNPPAEESSSATPNMRVDLKAIAKATTGFDAESTFKFIRNTYLYKGLSEPTKEELESVFKEVSSIHFTIALSS